MPLAKTNKFKNFQDLPEEAKYVPLKNMFNKLEEFQEKLDNGTLSEYEEPRMELLKNYIAVRLGVDSTQAEAEASICPIDDNCNGDEGDIYHLSIDEKVFIESHVPEYFFKACQKTPFFISQNKSQLN